MASYTRRVVKKKWMAWYTPAPATAAEMSKIFTAALADGKSHKYDTSYDDFLLIEADRCHIAVKYRMRDDDDRE